MNITVIGTGNGGTTISADLANKGHSITLVKSSKVNNDNYNFIKKEKKIYVKDLEEDYVSNIHKVTDDLADAIINAEVVIVFIQTSYHEELIKNISPYIQDNQVFIIEPGYLCTSLFLKYTTKKITVIEAESSPIDCRIFEPGHVQVLFKNVLNPFGVYPRENKEIAKTILNELKYPYVIKDNIVEVALHNPNLIVHTVGSIFSIPRIEYTNGEYWMYKEVFTPHIWNIVESLDEEKMDVLEKLNCSRIPYVEACKQRNSLDKSKNAVDVFFDYANNNSPKGPSIPDSRYITEDVPQGLVLLESLGKYFNIQTPTCTSLIDIASAALKREFRKEGRTIEKLGEENLKKILKEILNVEVNI